MFVVHGFDKENRNGFESVENPAESVDNNLNQWQLNEQNKSKEIEERLYG